MYELNLNGLYVYRFSYIVRQSCCGCQSYTIFFCGNDDSWLFHHSKLQIYSFNIRGCKEMMVREFHENQLLASAFKVGYHVFW